MQFDTAKTLLALALVYGAYAAVSPASSTHSYAVPASFVPFLVSGTVVWHNGFRYGERDTGARYGEFRAKRSESIRESRTDEPRSERRPSK